MLDTLPLTPLVALYEVEGRVDLDLGAGQPGPEDGPDGQGGRRRQDRSDLSCFVSSLHWL